MNEENRYKRNFLGWLKQTHSIPEYTSNHVIQEMYETYKKAGGSEVLCILATIGRINYEGILIYLEHYDCNGQKNIKT